MNAFHNTRLSSSIVLVLGIIAHSGCTILHKDRADLVDDRVPRARISGALVRDQVFSIPEYGLTAGEALGLALEDIELRRGIEDRLAEYYLAIPRRDEVLYLPLAMVRDGVAASVLIEPGDNLKVVNISTTVFNRPPDEVRPATRPTLVGFEPAEMFPIVRENSVDSNDATPEAIGERMLARIKANTGSSDALTIVNAVQVRRFASGRVHRLVLPAHVGLEEEDMASNELLSQLAGGIRPSDIYGKLANSSNQLVGGDVMEFTSFELIPEIRRGRARLEARRMLEQRQERLHSCKAKLQKSPAHDLLRPLTSRLEPISASFSAAARSLPGM